jgi:hypothetical protein
LYLSLEDSADVVRYRLRNVAHELCLDWQTIEQNLVVYEGDAPLATELSDQRGQRLIPQGPFAELQEIARGFGLVIIDNASDAFDANENSRRIVRGFVRGMLQKQLADDGCAVLLIAHVPKAKPGFKVESYSGSTAWHNSARARLAIASGDTGPELVQEKSNHGAPCEPVKLVWSGAVLRAMTADELLDGPAADLSAVLEAFGRVDEDMRVSVAPQGTRAAWPMLKTFLPKDWTSKRLAQTLEDLERAGKLRKVKYVDEHRNSRLVWEVV